MASRSFKDESTEVSGVPLRYQREAQAPCYMRRRRRRLAVEQQCTTGAERYSIGPYVMTYTTRKSLKEGKPALKQTGSGEQGSGDICLRIRSHERDVRQQPGSDMVMLGGIRSLKR